MPFKKKELNVTYSWQSCIKKTTPYIYLLIENGDKNCRYESIFVLAKEKSVEKPTLILSDI